MPANLPAEAEKALAKYQAARTIPEKIKALEEALSLIPDHKGTEKLRGRIKRRIAELKREVERKAAVRATRKDYFHVSREGAAQVAIIGVTNSGKSSLLKALTNAKPKISFYQLTTIEPTPGMMLHDGVELQLVELPAILTEDLEEVNFTNRSIGFAKNSDLILIVLDGSRDPVLQLEKIMELLDESGVALGLKRCEIEIEKKDSGGIRIVTFGKLHTDPKEVIDLLKSVGIRNAVLKIYGDAGIEDFEEVIIRDLMHKKAIIVVNKIDQVGHEALESIKEMIGSRIPVIGVSAERGDGLNDLKELIVRELDLIKVYTQKEGIRAEKPLIVKRGTTVRELAEIIHKEFAEKMRYARIWGRSVKIQGQKVGPDHVLEDGDIIEVFT